MMMQREEAPGSSDAERGGSDRTDAQTWTLDLVSGSVEQTLEIGRAIAAALAPGDVVAMVGHLGAGKTQLTKGLAVGLGVTDAREVNSPTFVLVNEYEGRVHIDHVDAYRLPSTAALETLGFREMCTTGGVVVVEWADRVRAAITPDALWVELQAISESGRRMGLRTESTSLAARLDAAGLDRWCEAGHKGRHR
jgi:tRNA threonylcarbamoyladenosine biosynthesis protein TsaE